MCPWVKFHKTDDEVRPIGMIAYLLLCCVPVECLFCSIVNHISAHVESILGEEALTFDDLVRLPGELESALA